MARADVILVLVRSNLWEVYGGERSTIVTARALLARGVRPAFLLTVDDNLAVELRALGFPVEIAPFGDPFAGFGSDSTLGKLGRVARLLAINAAICRLAIRGRTPIVHATAVPGFLCSTFGARLAGAVSIQHIRGVSSSGRTRWYEILAVTLGSETICISDSLKRVLVDTAPSFARGLLERDMKVVYNGFELDEIDRYLAEHSVASCRVALSLRESDKIALFVGTMNRNKGQLRFIEQVLGPAMAIAPTLRAAFVGGPVDPAYAAACHEAVRSLDIGDRVTFTGYLPLREVYQWYRAADVVVVASETEGHSRTAVEAQAFGLPVVSTRVVGPVDVVIDGQTGFLISEAELDGMARVLARLVADDALRARLGVAGAASVRARFGVERHVEALCRIYSELSGGSVGGSTRLTPASARRQSSPVGFRRWRKDAP